MATIKQFKQEIKNLTKAQKVAKRINHQSEVYHNRGSLHAMYVAYYILKHKLVGDAQEAYYKQVLDSWKKLKFNGWYGYSGGDYSKETWKHFVSRVDSLIDTYSDEEAVCADRPEA
jgi:hypothetical protein